MSNITTCQTNRFNFSSSNFSLFPENSACLENTPVVFTQDLSGVEIDDEGRWMIGGKNYTTTGGPSNQTFQRRYVRKQCPVTFNIVVIPKWVLPKKPIFRDNSMGLKRGQLFTNTAYKLKKSEKMKMLSSKRFNR
tara:strand:- start:88 stop:492 length:405 start_codon:yes stop_codon:yes gene_type:complete